MHEHGKVVLSAAQLAIFSQFAEALNKGKQMAQTYNDGAVIFEHVQKQIGEISGNPIYGLAPTGNVKVCPACLTALPVVLRELADMFDELAVKLDLPETKAKTKFGV